MSSTTRIGIDLQSNRLLIARVSSDENDVLECAIESRAAFAAVESSTAAPVAIAVPDREVAVKSLCLRLSASLELLPRASFELAQSVLEPPERFHFDAVATPISDRFIGLIYRRERLEALRFRVLVSQNGSSPEPHFLMRAVALGYGYGRFAQPDSDSLLCLADLTAGTVSLCLLYNRSVIAVGHMAAGALSASDDRSMRAFGVDLKSLVNYQLAGCAQHGLSVPLSAVVLCGELARPEVQGSVASHFSARVVMPQPQTETMHVESSDESVRFADCLVALGLTVN